MSNDDAGVIVRICLSFLSTSCVRDRGEFRAVIDRWMGKKNRSGDCGVGLPIAHGLCVRDPHYESNATRHGIRPGQTVAF